MKKELVRCLGPGKEHYFRSPDKARIRICRKCQARLKRRTIYEWPRLDRQDVDTEQKV